jgi:large subunit ribosomal protein L11
MAKEITKIIKLQIEAGKATPAPPVGTALGPAGVNIGEFVNQFNALTRPMMGSVVPVLLTVYKDRTFTFIVKKPPASRLILKAMGIEKGSQKPQNKIGKLTKAQLEDVAKEKIDGDRRGIIPYPSAKRNEPGETRARWVCALDVEHSFGKHDVGEGTKIDVVLDGELWFAARVHLNTEVRTHISTPARRLQKAEETEALVGCDSDMLSYNRARCRFVAARLSASNVSPLPGRCATILKCRYGYLD